jgi:hypothetical protein
MTTDNQSIALPTPQTTVPLDFLAPAILQALLRKIAGFRGGKDMGEWSYEFSGLREADVVFATAQILESVGYDVYLERKVDDRRVDICVQSWLGDTIWCEVKALWDTRDNRLNKKRYLSDSGSEILKDVKLLSTPNAAKGRRIFIIAAFSPSDNLECCDPHKKTLRLGDLIKGILDLIGPPIYSRQNLCGYVQAKPHCQVLHCFSWVK